MSKSTSHDVRKAPTKRGRKVAPPNPKLTRAIKNAPEFGPQDTPIKPSTGSLSEFLSTGKFAYSAGGCGLIPELHEGGGSYMSYVTPGGLVCSPVGAGMSPPSVRSIRMSAQHFANFSGWSPDVCGVVMESPREGAKWAYIQRHDAWFTDPPGQPLPQGGPPDVSIYCLGGFFVAPGRNTREATFEAGLHALSVGRLLDYSGGVTLPIPPKQRTRLTRCVVERNRSKILEGLVPPSPGFEVDRGSDRWVWHRPSTCLIHSQGRTILLGVDEETFFGCELQGAPKTVSEGYNALTPEALRGKNCPRQGEWFAVPVPKEDFPDITEAIALGGDKGIVLPITYSGSNRHRVWGSVVLVMHDGVYVCNVTLEHDEGIHAALRLHGMYRFVRNAAIRSFSEEGGAD